MRRQKKYPPTNERHENAMNREEYLSRINDMLHRIDNSEYLNRILNYVQKYYVKEKSEK